MTQHPVLSEHAAATLLERLSAQEEHLLYALLDHRPVSRDTNQQFDASLTVGQRPDNMPS